MTAASSYKPGATELSAPQPGCRRADRQYSAGLLRLCWLLRRALRPFHHEGSPPPPMGCDAGQASCGETRCVADGHPAPRQGPVWRHQRAEGSPWIERPARNNAPADEVRSRSHMGHCVAPVPQDRGRRLYELFRELLAHTTRSSVRRSITSDRSCFPG